MQYLAGVDVGGTSAKVGLVDREGKILAQDEVAIDARGSFGQLGRRIGEKLTGLHRKAAGKLLAIGIGTPGFTDSRTGILVGGAENIPCLKNNSLAGYLEGELKAPAFADNDATCAAAGELKFGIGKTYKNFIFITLGTGIGGGLVLDGKVFRGSQGFAAEIGHMCLDRNGVWCNCGSRGCFEQYASAPAIIRHYREKCLKRGLPSMETLTAKLIFDLAGQGDTLAAETIREAAQAIAQVFGTLTNLLNPDACIIGGGVSRAGEQILKPVKEHISDYAWPLLLKDLNIHIAQLQNDAGLLGAAAQALERAELSCFLP